MEPKQTGSTLGTLAALSLLVLPTLRPLPAQHKPPAATRPLPAPPAPAAPKGAIAPGTTIRDSLGPRDLLLAAESTYAQPWSLAGTAGAVVTIDVASDAFDAYAFLLGPGLDKPLQDDDSGGHCNARITARLPQTGDYTIVVTSAEKFATGPFSLSVTIGRKPTSLSPCPR
jgi:hypothetical protein